MKILFEDSVEKEILSRNLSRAGGCPEIFGVEMESALENVSSAGRQL